jgi:hypothetical protein
MKTTIVKRRDGTTIKTQKGGQNRPKRNQGQRRGNKQLTKNAINTGGSSFRSRNPQIKTDKTSIIVSHTEMVAPVNGLPTNVDFLPIKYECDITSPDMFPWLRNLALAYEKWRIKKMSFRYTTTTSTFAVGSAYMFIDYDVTDDYPASIREMAQATDCFVTESVWKNFSLRVFPNQFAQTKSFLIPSQTEVLTPEQKILYNPFNLYVGSNSTTLEGQLGYVWCDYEVELMVPSLEQTSMPYNFQGYWEGPINTASGFNMDPLQLTSSTAQSGNMVIKFIRNGFKFMNKFNGFLTLRIASAGFDSTRVPSFVAGVGATVNNAYWELKDIALGTDSWYGYVYINSPTGGTVIVTGNLTGSADETSLVNCWFSTVNPRWTATLDPNVAPITWDS